MQIHRIVALIGLTFAPLIGSGAGAADALYFPPAGDSWARVEPASVGWDARALDAALEYAGAQRSSGVVVLLNGRILAERSWDVKGSGSYARMRIAETTDGRAIEDVASAQKSIVAVLAGIAEGRRQLNLAAPVDRYLGKGWSNADAQAEGLITVRHLMAMTSGLDDSLTYRHPPGTEWRYNTGAYSRMVGILEKATGSDIATLTRDWLTAPAGMRDSRWVPRPWSAGNDAANSIGYATSARDLSRFGLMILAGGKWERTDLIRNPGFLARMLSPSQDLNPSYGLLWWLNSQPGVRPGRLQEARTALIPVAPDDLVAALGALGRKCYVVPSLSLVVSRLGDEPGEAFNNEFWALLMKAAPKPAPNGRRPK